MWLNLAYQALLGGMVCGVHSTEGEGNESGV